jgi:hypothetical protein
MSACSTTAGGSSEAGIPEGFTSDGTDPCPKLRSASTLVGVSSGLHSAELARRRKDTTQSPRLCDRRARKARVYRLRIAARATVDPKIDVSAVNNAT